MKRKTGFTGHTVAVGLQLEKFDGYPPIIITDERKSDDSIKKLELAIDSLPKSQRPLFVRWRDEIPLTPTFKVKRNALKSEALQNLSQVFVVAKSGLRPISDADLAMIQGGQYLFE